MVLLSTGKMVQNRNPARKPVDMVNYMGFIHVRRAGFIPSTVPYLMLYLHRLYIYYSTLTLLQNRWF